MISYHITSHHITHTTLLHPGTIRFEYHAIASLSKTLPRDKAPPPIPVPVPINNNVMKKRISMTDTNLSNRALSSDSWLIWRDSHPHRMPRSCSCNWTDMHIVAQVWSGSNIEGERGCHKYGPDSQFSMVDYLADLWGRQVDFRVILGKRGEGIIKQVQSYAYCRISPTAVGHAG
ncbi:hypothetical protein L873DRAFT_1256719 [Choiromyces venosus 120613-1]|uniref:Uncharacterized protein n=1 Tax=Choiromyces venosus 120613-1 TaxID=1336337 RepID=A0A3N4JHN5_9PEZI|nr:hypothetical protein L873DRAFT_1256719 [Choiromyces venosus 120613-1]